MKKAAHNKALRQTLTKQAILILEADIIKMGLSGAEAEEEAKKYGEDVRLRDLVDRLGIRIGLVPVTVRMYYLSLFKSLLLLYALCI